MFAAIFQSITSFTSVLGYFQAITCNERKHKGYRKGNRLKQEIDKRKLSLTLYLMEQELDFIYTLIRNSFVKGISGGLNG